MPSRGRNAPLAAGECRRADAGGSIGVVAGDDEARIDDGVGRCVVVIEGGIEVEDAPLFFREAAIPVIAQSRGE